MLRVSVDSPTKDYDIITASEGQAPLRGRKIREASLIVGVSGPDGVFTKQGRGLVPAVARKKHAMATIPARPKLE